MTTNNQAITKLTSTAISAVGNLTLFIGSDHMPVEIDIDKTFLEAAILPLLNTRIIKEDETSAKARELEKINLLKQGKLADLLAFSASSSGGENPTGDLLEQLFRVKVSRWNGSRGSTETEKAAKDGQNILINYPIGTEQCQTEQSKLAAWIKENNYLLCKVDSQTITDQANPFGLTYSRIYIEKIIK